MKLFRFGAFEQEKPGVELSDGKSLDVSGFGEDFNEQFFATDGLSRLQEWLKENQADCPILEKGFRYGSCVARPSKIVCVGMNYAKHAYESGATELPKEPIIFFKATSALCGPFDNVVIPRGSEKTDWEVELAVVIGKRASYVSEEDALSYVAGYAIHNDYSERAYQLERGGQWVKGKSNDTFAPIGPYLVPASDVANPNQLDLWLSLNGKKIQDSNTSDMIFQIPFLVSYLSQFMSLLPGDVITTGTPAGVGLGMKPQVYLKPGDIVELGIEGLGVQRQEAQAWKA
ncbi:2-keto-4-pentenoate hydratase/2-oxohepta-3-ene-1,7-dioic acid hydratase in catechol pathway [Dyadobacter jejuensis]|uniref:2-keto-4-pentenoate hydratase/2-oxohepta-3-ene-1,7-dioic acid hydratase in catechol pathway n=1 Tax=Dyadobacter jejuensis TaxID=1082580 RepID=A0A316AMS1_9BACT|nr:fumarylacetoacetate hydrolase family protein [Dyadobacter jejuensis]PWJ58394.1 2-keto-4-pentenoate hydratase/2-oxohepta-3-ene-1,7-dioic acid hydratase in catechol pathway [Dyadobacter jejuensis]